jgi:hypothetical protein
VTKEDCYHLAVKTGLWQSTPIKDTALMAVSLVEFVELVAAAEREACCLIVYAQCESDNVAHRTVNAIRTRGERQL